MFILRIPCLPKLIWEKESIWFIRRLRQYRFTLGNKLQFSFFPHSIPKHSCLTWWGWWLRCLYWDGHIYANSSGRKSIWIWFICRAGQYRFTLGNKLQFSFFPLRPHSIQKHGWFIYLTWWWWWQCWWWWWSLRWWKWYRDNGNEPRPSPRGLEVLWFPLVVSLLSLKLTFSMFSTFCQSCIFRYSWHFSVVVFCQPTCHLHCRTSRGRSSQHCHSPCYRCCGAADWEWFSLMCRDEEGEGGIMEG